MPRFDANLTQLYTEYPFLDRFTAAAADGFEGVEYRGAYDHPVEVLSELLRANGLTQVSFNLPAGNWSGGDRGIACLPGREAEFRDGVEVALGYAEALGCSQLNCLAGLMPSDISYSELEDVLVGNLTYAAERLQTAGITLLIEALNRKDLPTCMLASTKQLERIHDRVGSRNLRFQYDFYHVQVMEGEVLATFERLFDRIGHIQIADFPGRHEPGTGEMNYRLILEEVDRLGYDGWVGCEYVPLASTSEGLRWRTELVP
jgi:hydroxypyruvate isomerase